MLPFYLVTFQINKEEGQMKFKKSLGHSLRSWQNCICVRSFGGEAAILAALPQEASAEGARQKRLLPILRAASSPLPSQNFARANDPAGYAGY